MLLSTPYSFEVTLPIGLAGTERRVREALRTEEFGVVAEIDIAAKLRETLGISHPPHKILGVCHPALAARALEENEDVALVLPCNIVLREEGGETVVSAFLPTVALRPFAGEEVGIAANLAESSLTRVFESLERSFLSDAFLTLTSFLVLP